MKLVAQELLIHASADQLYELLVDPELFVQWMADDAELDPTPGGRIRWTHANGDTCSGTYVELIPGRRVVFTYGWERPDPDPPPSRSTSSPMMTTPPCSSWSTAVSTTPQPRPTMADGATTSTGSARPPKARPQARTRSSTDAFPLPRSYASHGRPDTR